MLSDHDDTLEPDALYEIVKAINDHQGPEIVYTDEEKCIVSLCKETGEPYAIVELKEKKR